MKNTVVVVLQIKNFKFISASPDWVILLKLLLKDYWHTYESGEGAIMWNISPLVRAPKARLYGTRPSLHVRADTFASFFW